MRSLSSRAQFLRWIPGVVLSGLALYLLFRLVDWKALAVSWRSADPWYFLPAAALLVGAMAARSAGWRLLLDRRLSPARSFWILNVAYLLNVILPFRLGDLSRAVLVGGSRPDEQSEVSASQALSSVVVERVLDLMFTFLITLAALPFIAGRLWGARALGWTLLVAAAGIAGVVVLGRLRTLLVPLATRAGTAWARRVDDFLAGLEKAQHWRRTGPAAFFIGLAWLAWLLEYFVMLRSFVPGASFGQGLMALLGSALGVMIPSSPGALGVFEASVVAALTLVGVPLAPALACALTTHALNSLGVALLGMVGMLMEGQSLGAIVSKVWPSRGGEASPPLSPGG